MKKTIITLSLLLFAFGSATAGVQQYNSSPSEMTSYNQDFLSNTYKNPVFTQNIIYSFNNFSTTNDSYDSKSGDSKTTSLPQVPEPTTMILFALGLAGGAVRKKFKQTV